VEDYFDRIDGSDDEISDNEMECGKAIVFIKMFYFRKQKLRITPGNDQQELDSESEQGTYLQYE